MDLLVPPTSDADRVAAIERAFELHWRHFGLYPGASLHDEDGVLWFESPLRHLPYNWAIRTRIPADRDPDEVLQRVAARFRARDVPFMWVHRPSDAPGDLGRRLEDLGLTLGETATGMDLELAEYPGSGRSSAAEVVVVDDEDRLHDYEELIRTYWSVPVEDRHHITTLNRHWTGERSPGVRFVAYLDGAPVGKLFLNTVEVPEQVAVYGVAVRPEARGRGVAGHLMEVALGHARASGAARCVLHSSQMALPMYTRMGFTARCTLPVYATGSIFGTHHH